MDKEDKQNKKTVVDEGNFLEVIATLIANGEISKEGYLAMNTRMILNGTITTKELLDSSPNFLDILDLGLNKLVEEFLF